MMRTELVDDWARVPSLEPEWNSLLNESRANTLFLRWEWIRCWLAVAGTVYRPLIVLVWDEQDRLAAIAPFYVTRLYLGGLWPYRTLRILADYATGSDYPDWIVRSDCEAAAAEAIARALATAPVRWDCIWMPNVAGWTGADARLAAACARSAFYYHARPRDFAFLTLPHQSAAYHENLSANKRQQLRREWKRLRVRPDVQIIQCQTLEELPRFLQALFDLHHRRWRQRGEEGTFRRKPLEAAFYRMFAPCALRNNWLRLWGLEEAGDLKAVQLGYVYDKVFYQIQEGFDPEYLVGVGNVLRNHVIDACIAEGLTAIDFLGEMTEHKRRWLAKERRGWDFLIGRPGLKARLLFARRIWPTGRFFTPVPRWSRGAANTVPSTRSYPNGGTLSPLEPRILRSPQP